MTLEVQGLPHRTYALLLCVLLLHRACWDQSDTRLRTGTQACGKPASPMLSRAVYCLSLSNTSRSSMHMQITLRTSCTQLPSLSTRLPAALRPGWHAGYRWVLQKEGEAPLQRQNSRSTWAGGTAGEVEQLRAELRQRGDQLGGLRAEIMGLEATRNE